MRCRGVERIMTSTSIPSVQVRIARAQRLDLENAGTAFLQARQNEKILPTFIAKILQSLRVRVVRG